MEMNSVQLADCFGTAAAVLDTSALKCTLPEKVSQPLWILCDCVQQYLHLGDRLTACFSYGKCGCWDPCLTVRGDACLYFILFPFPAAPELSLPLYSSNGLFPSVLCFC